MCLHAGPGSEKRRATGRAFRLRFAPAFVAALVMLGCAGTGGGGRASGGSGGNAGSGGSTAVGEAPPEPEPPPIS